MCGIVDLDFVVRADVKIQGVVLVDVVIHS